MTEQQGALVLRNLGVLVFVAMPTTIVAILLYERLFRGSWELSSPLDLLTPYFATVLQMSVGGFIHQMLVVTLPDTWDLRWRRVLTVLTSPVCLCVLALTVEFDTLTTFAIPIGIGGIVYNLLIRLPQRRSETVNPGE